LDELLEFHEIERRYYAIESDLDAMFYIAVDSNRPKMANVQTSEVDAKLAPVNVKA
jgi:hypothetical protein